MRPSLGLLTASALCALCAGCSGSGDKDAVLVYVDIAASREGLSPAPDLVHDEATQRAADRARQEYAERVEAAVPAVERELRRLGAREVSVRRAPPYPHPYLRARVAPTALADLERRDDVDRVWRARTLTGRIERDDLVLLLVADDGNDYVLGEVGWHGLQGGERVEVEGSDWRGASIVWHSRGHNFIAREVKRL